LSKAQRKQFLHCLELQDDATDAVAAQLMAKAGVASVSSVSSVVASLCVQGPVR
jgi:hypothetical protein